MARFFLVLVLICAVAGFLALLVAHPAATPASGPIYTVAQVRVLVVREPRLWAGRVIVLSAEAVHCRQYVHVDAHTVCAAWQDGLIDPQATGTAASLPLEPGPVNLLLALVRQVPIVSGVIPAAQELRWGIPSTYRVQLRALPDTACSPICYEAMVLDTTR